MEGTRSILGRKLRMTQVFDAEGRRIPVTVIQAGPCPILQVKTKERDGYEALQVGFGVGRKVIPKALAGHVGKSKAASPRWIREIPHPGEELALGHEITVAAFEATKKVDVSGVTKGRGTAGVVKRWGFTKGPVTHGTKNVREGGSMGGGGADPGKIWKGKRMPGRYGAERLTVKNLELVRVEKEKHLLFVRGAIPGPSGGLVIVRSSRGKAHA